MLKNTFETMKSKIINIEKMEKNNLVHFDNSIILCIPSMINLEENCEMDINIYHQNSLMGKKNKILLNGIVIRNYDSYSIVSFGGLLGQIPYNDYNIDDTLSVTLN